MANPFAAELSVCIRDRGCEHFISLSVCRSGTTALVVMKSPDNSASEAEDMTMFIIWSRERMGPLSRGIGSFSGQKMCTPERQRIRVSLRYDALERASKIMLLDI